MFGKVSPLENGSRGGIRTRDLQVMSLTSCLTALPLHKNGDYYSISKTCATLRADACDVVT